MPTEQQKIFHSDNKRLVKNTGVLYLRMLFTVAISFYTTRLILANLGVNDFGLYNVIGGFVSMFFMITMSLSTAISRFISFELGKGNLYRLNKIFITSVNIQVFLSFIVLLIGETVGLWFVNTQLNMAPTRLVAANYLYQFSLISFLWEMITVPYNACVISHEKMTLYAYATIINVILKLIIALMLAFAPFDRLIYYGMLMMLISILNFWIYYKYCQKQFDECHYVCVIDKGIIKEMIGFSGWSFLGGASDMLRTQGLDILLNVFFGTPMNAARGVATQVENTTRAFSVNFMTALTPQIAKNYASGNKEEACKQTYEGCKFSFLMMFIVSFPIIIETPQLLAIWLKEVPTYAVAFVRLTIVFSYLDIMVRPIRFLNNATGKIRNFQIVQSAGQFAVLPLAYFCLKAGLSPLSVLYVLIFIELSLVLPRVQLNKKEAGLRISTFFDKVIMPISFVLIPTCITMFIIYSFIPETIYRIPLTIVCSTSITLLTSYFFALTGGEKSMVKNVIIKKILDRVKK